MGDVHSILSIDVLCSNKYLQWQICDTFCVLMTIKNGQFLETCCVLMNSKMGKSSDIFCALQTMEKAIVETDCIVAIIQWNILYCDCYSVGIFGILHLYLSVRD